MQHLCFGVSDCVALFGIGVTEECMDKDNAMGDSDTTNLHPATLATYGSSLPRPQHTTHSITPAHSNAEAGLLPFGIGDHLGRPHHGESAAMAVTAVAGCRCGDRSKSCNAFVW